MVRRTGDARCLLRLGLIVTLLALDALVHRAIQVCSRGADRQRALLNGSRSHLRGGTSQGAVVASRLNALRSVRATWAGFATVLRSQLLSRRALIATLVPGCGLRRSRGLSQSAELTGEGALTWLEESKATRLAETGFGVQVLSGRAALFAVTGRTSASSYSHASTAGNVRATQALRLTSFGLVVSLRARHTSLVGGLKGSADGAWDAIGHHHNLPNGTGVLRDEVQGSWVGDCVGQNVLNSKLVVFQDELLQQGTDVSTVATGRVQDWVAVIELRVG